MVITNNPALKNKTQTSVLDSASEATQENKNAEAYAVDPELFSSEYNQTRRPSLPYGIVINDNPAGILIPTEQLIKAEWNSLPPEAELTTVELTEEVTGLLLQKVKMLVLAFVPEYIRYKDIEENGELAGVFVGLYDEYRHSLDKKTQDVCSEHALLFLNPKNQPLHKSPIVVRFKNVALWSFKSAREEFYRNLEKAFADYFEVEYSGKNDKWRSLGVLNVEFRAIKEGEGKNKSFCCKTHSIVKPTRANLPKLYLGKSQQKKTVWGLHKSIAGFVEAGESQLPALAAGADRETVRLAQPEVQVLPASSTENRYSKGREKGQSKLPRKIAQVEKNLDAGLEEPDNFQEVAEVEIEVDAETDFD
ncbi:MAG: DUF5895 domain-containing protein [Oscillatoriaceae cyanobacterium Prado104]|jgi:hypothetical protein|nr:DUF5895 domain-containing protein [Oscillatoriaceae cyanobacterium Prado104]